MKPILSAPRLRKLLVWCAGLLLFYTVFGFLILPHIIRAVAVKQLGKQLNREVSIEKVRLNPYALSVDIRGLKVRDPGTETLFSWDQVYVNLQAVSFFGHAWVFDEVAVVNPYGRLQVNKDYTLNISDILRAHAATNGTTKAQTRAAAPTLRIRQFRVEGARVAITDLTPNKPFHRVIGPVKIALTDFHTDPNSRNPHLFTGSTDTGETFSWDGQFSLDPVRAAGELSVDHVALNKFAPLYEDFVRFEIRDGVASFHANYRFEQGQSGVLAAVSNASFALRSFKLANAGAPTNFLEVPEFSVSGVNGDFLTRRVEVGSVAVRGASLTVARERGAEFNLVQAAQANTNQSAPSGILMLLNSATNLFARLLSSTNLATGTLRELAVQDCAVTLSDQSPDRPVELRLEHINLAARNLSNRPDTNMTSELSLNWNTNGRVASKWNVSLSPLNADLGLKIERVELAPLSPYLDSFMNLYALGSKLSLDGTFRVRSGEGGVPVATFAGNGALEDLRLAGAGGPSDDLLKWSTLRLEGMAAGLTPPGITVTNIVLQDLAARVVVQTNHTLNVMSVMRSDRTGESVSTNQTTPVAATPPASSGSPIKRAFAQLKSLLGMETNTFTGLPPLQVDTISIENGELQLVDQSVSPPARASLQKVHGTIKDLSTEELRRAQVHLEALAGGTGPIEVSGQLNPLNAKKSTEAKLTVKNVKLNPADPYAGKYLGYRLSRGELNVNFDYTINASQVKGRNYIVLDQVTLGDKVASPDATHLPVKLALALLKDRSGKIEIDVPVEGNLDDPQFRLGKVIWHVIGNVFVKAVTSPFALLGSLVGGGKSGEEMQFQEFAPGSTELDAVAQQKLADVAKALAARPELQLEIEGNVDPNLDGAGLRRARLERELRTAYWRSLRASAREKTPAESIVLTPEQRQEVLEKEWKALQKTNLVAAAIMKSDVAEPAMKASEPAPAIQVRSRAAQPLEERGATYLLAGRMKPNTPSTAVTPQPQSQSIPVAASQPALEPGAKPTLEQMEQALMARLNISEEELAALAAARAHQVQTNLVQELKIPPDRVLLSQPAEGIYGTNGHRVVLQLR